MHIVSCALVMQYVDIVYIACMNIWLVCIYDLMFGSVTIRTLGYLGAQTLCDSILERFSVSCLCDLLSVYKMINML